MFHSIVDAEMRTKLESHSIGEEYRKRMEANSKVRLNIGAGKTVIDGFTPIDRKLGHEADALEYADGSVDEIRASHVLEHFSFVGATKALKEWFRVLKPGARIRIAVPDCEIIGTMKTDPSRMRYLFGGQVDSDDFHHSGYTSDSLRRALVEAGFLGVMPWASDNTDTASHPCSLNLEAIKPDGETRKFIDMKMCGVMSIPRCGFNDAWGCIHEAFAPFNIPIRRFGGAYWDQGMQTLLEGCIKDGLDWVICMDYDTLFTADHLDKMFGWFGRHSNIHALAALQPMRTLTTPLMTVQGELDIRVTGRPVRVDTAHFGLTLIRLSKLKDVPKPWFLGVPGPSGEWKPSEHTDPDIYFWIQWKKAGLSVYVAPDVRVGHIELVVSEFDEDMNHRQVSVKEWRTRHSLSPCEDKDESENSPAVETL